MKRAGLNQKTLAARSGVSPASISEYVNRISAPGIDAVNEVANALDIPAWLLLVDPDSTPEETIALILRKWGR